jgi:hypothetical protein
MPVPYFLPVIANTYILWLEIYSTISVLSNFSGKIFVPYIYQPILGWVVYNYKRHYTGLDTFSAMAETPVSSYLPV